MRFRCIMAMIVFCAGLLSTHHRTAIAQPYQKVWTGPSQRGGGTYQKSHGGALDAMCQPPCYPPCQRPCEADRPKDAEPDAPRAAAPGIAPGVFVSPPQSGVVEGPSSGFEIGDVSLTLPEIKLGLPRLRWEGMKRLSRDARLMTDRAAAPYVGNPYYAAAVAQQQAASRDAEPDEEDEDDKGAEQQDAEKDAAARGPCQEDLESRIRRLEDSFEMQVQALQDCVEQLRALRSAESAYQKSSSYLPQPPPYNDAEARSDLRIRSPRLLPPAAPPVFGQEAAQMNYEVSIPADAVPRPLPPRRLPATTQ